MFENIRLSLRSIWGHKLRSILTMLGVIIGIASIVAIVSTIEGTNEQIKQNLVGSGTNTVEVQLCQGDYAVELEYMTLPAGIPVIDSDTRDSIEALDTVEYASLYTERTYVSNIFYENTAFSGSVRGVDDHYLNVYGYQVYLGRGFVEKDFSAFHKVALLDQKAVKALFSGENPIGKTIEIGSEPFTVIGVIAKRSTYEPVINSLSDYYTYADTSSGIILLPSTIWPDVYSFDEPQSCAVRAVSTDDMTAAGKSVEDILNARLQVDSDSDFSYKSQNALEQAKSLQEIASSTSMQLIWIAGISLAVGAIGVANIMLVSVSERTREIGLKKAIGAKKGRILWQFLTEAAALTGFGGILGAGIGVAVSRVISSVNGTPSAVNVPWTLGAVCVSVFVGLLSGLAPAVKAANLNPIEALRRE